MFVKTAKQRIACQLMNSTEHTLLYGGSRSSKTSIAVRNIILRALKKPSRHLIVRLAFNHAKTSIWYDTLPKVLAGFFPGLKYTENKTDWFITLPTICGNTSTIWLGGTDDKQRVEKILGNEYSTILCNEISQMAYDIITTLRTRLAENSGLSLRMYYDCNPSGKKHWSYQEFVEKLIPGTRELSTLDSTYLLMNPADNAENLPAAYLKLLESLPKRQKDRYLKGLYLSEIEGALWTDEMVSHARTNIAGEIQHIVIAVDPAVTNKPNSDETGIIPCGIDEFKNGVVLDDLSIKASTTTWAQRVVNAYNDYGAEAVVVEVNNGGDLVSDALKNIDPTVKIVTVHASTGKFARAEPISGLYELGRVCHIKDMIELEGQMTEYVPLNSNKSPDRLDALVWGLTYLMLRGAKKINVAV